VINELREKREELLEIKRSLESSERLAKTIQEKQDILQKQIDLNHKIEALRVVMELFT